MLYPCFCLLLHLRFNVFWTLWAKERRRSSNFFPSYQPHGLRGPLAEGVNAPVPQQKAFKGLKGGYSFLAISLFQGLKQGAVP